MGNTIARTSIPSSSPPLPPPPLTSGVGAEVGTGIGFEVGAGTGFEVGFGVGKIVGIGVGVAVGLRVLRVVTGVLTTLTVVILFKTVFEKELEDS